jgi:hypothetical protein
MRVVFMNMKEYSLSILVTFFHNRLEQFKRSINSIYYQHADFNKVELLLLDDGGNGEVLKLLANYRGKFPIRYFHIDSTSSSYSNSATRRNFLIKQAYGTYILITDPEIVHCSETITQTQTAFQKYGEAIWYCGSVFGTNSMVKPNGELALYDRKNEKNIAALWGEEPSFHSALNTEFFRTSKAYHKVNQNMFQELFWCSAMSKRIAARVNGCNENMLVYGYEDIELFKRMKKEGVRRVFDSEYIVYHLPHQITLSPAEQRYWFIYNQFVPHQKGFGKLNNIPVQTKTLFP